MSLLFFLACPAPDSPLDSPAPDSDPLVDDSGPGEQGLVVYEGRGSLVEGVYTGEEAWLVEHEEDGRVLCRIQYLLESVGPADCEACDWAVEAKVLQAEVSEEDSPGCAELSMDPAALEGSTVLRGYQSEYLGHGDVLMVPIDDYWSAVSFADFDTETGDFEYRWEDGYRGI